MRVILDANVVIAAAASRGLCEAILELCLDHHAIILCEGLLNEIDRKLCKKLKIVPSVAAEYIRILRNNAEVLVPEDVDKNECRDAKDLMVLGLVGPGRADVIVTGDNDLLVLAKYQGANIMNPRSFWNVCTKQK